MVFTVFQLHDKILFSQVNNAVLLPCGFSTLAAIWSHLALLRKYECLDPGPRDSALICLNMT